MSTYFPSGKDLANDRKWFVVDANGKTVGRLATEVARILSGKNNPDWTPFMDMGDCCVVINARHAVFNGSKNDQKMYLPGNANGQHGQYSHDVIFEEALAFVRGMSS